eukprot:4849536-Pyramimonas_sp.AAC.1
MATTGADMATTGADMATTGVGMATTGVDMDSVPPSFRNSWHAVARAAATLPKGNTGHGAPG